MDGEDTSCKLFFRFSYLIEDLEIERHFRVSMNLKVCFEASNDARCIINIDVFKNSLLPKSVCDWTAGFSTPSKHSFAFLFILIT